MSDELMPCGHPLKGLAYFCALCADAERSALTARLEEAERERDEARAEQVAAACAWEEYARWPGDYGCVPIGRWRGPDGVEHEMALRAEQITGLTRGIEKHVRSLIPFGVAALKSHQDIEGVRSRLSESERVAGELAGVVGFAARWAVANGLSDHAELARRITGLSPAARALVEGGTNV